MKSVLIKMVDPELFKRFKALAVLRGITLSQAFNEAMELWINSCEKSLGIRSESDVDSEFFSKVRGELDRKYRGKYVLIANRRVIAVVNDIREAYRVLEREGLNKCLIYKAGMERERGEWLWSSIEP